MKLKRLLALLLAAILCLSLLSACTKNKPEETKPASGETLPAGQNAAAPNGETGAASNGGTEAADTEREASTEPGKEASTDPKE